MTTKDVLALALEALEKLAEHGAYSLSIAEPAITAIKQAQEQKVKLIPTAEEMGTPMQPQAITPETGNAANPEASAITAGNGQAQEPVQHDSDCSLHNGPAYPAGPCDCSQSKAPKQADPAWQPIESAPKDGRDIIVYFKTVGIRQVSWCDEYGDPSGEYALWRVDDNKHGPYALRGYRPGDDTHWMHLPTPPEAT